MSKTTWRKELAGAFDAHGDSFDKIEGKTISDAELDVGFDDGYGGAEGIPFTVWTSDRVYFPAQYDGSEWVASVPRHPNGEATDHIGGG